MYVGNTFELADSLVVSLVGTQPSVIRMKETFKTWWDGTYSPPENYPGSALIFTTGTVRRSWPSKAAHLLAEFWLKHWQYMISTGIAVVGIFIAIRKL